MHLSISFLPLVLLPTTADAQESHTTLTTSATRTPTTLTRTLTTSTSTITLATASALADPSWADDSRFKSACIENTNTYRVQHGAPALAWNETLARWATRWTSRCLWAHSGLGFGENLAEGFADVASAVDGWGDERRTFDFAHPRFTEQTGHFSQLVWKGTKSVGCGRAYCKTDGSRNNRIVARDDGDKAAGWFLACEYWPPGNVEGAFGENVRSQISNGDTTHGLISGGGASEQGFIGKSGAHLRAVPMSAVLAAVIATVVLLTFEDG